MFRDMEEGKRILLSFLTSFCVGGSCNFSGFVASLQLISVAKLVCKLGFNYLSDGSIATWTAYAYFFDLAMGQRTDGQIE